ncbi:MAG: rhomboid family intramembrane serine protease [Planctomycetota bacterium]
MIPLRDLNPARNFPSVTVAIIAINALVFVLTMHDLGGAAQRFGAIPALYTGDEIPAIVDGPPHRILRALSHMWMHGSFMHVLGNMWFLWVFGDNVEDRLGRARFAFLYFLAGFVAFSAQVISAPGFQGPMIGASGAVSGVLGAYLVLYPRARVLTLVPIGWFLTTMVWPAFVFLGLWFGLQVLQGVLTPPDVGGVAWWAHSAGFVVGLGLGRVLARPEPQRKIRVDVGSWR